MPTSSRKKTPAKSSKPAAPATKKPAPKPAPAAKKVSKPPVKAAAKPAARPATPVKATPAKPVTKPVTKPVAKPVPPPAKLPVKTAAPVTKVTPPAPAKGAPAKPAAPKPAAAAAPAAAKPAVKPGAPGPKPGTPEAKADARAAAAAAAPPAAKPAKPPKKSARRMIQRRGPDGELLAPGELLLPKGVQHVDESLYLLRGVVAAEHPAPDEGVLEIQTKRKPEANIEDAEIARQREMAFERFETSQIESLMPVRPPGRRTFQGVVERAKHRRREIGAFLRGLDIGRTEASHMDSHGEASLQSLMEWAARLEVLAEADEPEKADYAQFLRVLDQLDNTTETLVVDVELTLRRLRDRLRAAGKA